MRYKKQIQGIYYEFLKETYQIGRGLKQNIGILGQEEEEMDEMHKNQWQNFTNLEKDRGIQIQKGHRTPNTYNQKRSSLRHTKIKFSKIKQKGKTCA